MSLCVSSSGGFSHVSNGCRRPLTTLNFKVNFKVELGSACKMNLPSRLENLCWVKEMVSENISMFCFVNYTKYTCKHIVNVFIVVSSMKLIHMYRCVNINKTFESGSWFLKYYLDQMDSGATRTHWISWWRLFQLLTRPITRTQAYRTNCRDSV